MTSATPSEIIVYAATSGNESVYCDDHLGDSISQDIVVCRCSAVPGTDVGSATPGSVLTEEHDTTAEFSYAVSDVGRVPPTNSSGLVLRPLALRSSPLCPRLCPRSSPLCPRPCPVLTS
eukprot:3940509-Rhodomonas_salina.1